MIVEDNNGLRNIFEYELREAGFEVLKASSGEEALQVLASNKVNVLVADINLGGKITGLDVVKQCRKDNAEAKVIVVTGMVDVRDQDALEARFPDADTILFKPFDYGELTKAVTTLVAT